jgi:ribosomal protein S27AE
VPDHVLKRREENAARRAGIIKGMDKNSRWDDGVSVGDPWAQNEVGAWKMNRQGPRKWWIGEQERRRRQQRAGFNRQDQFEEQEDATPPWALQGNLQRKYQITPQEAREGDWECPKCGHMNFQTRSACQKCGTDQPDGDDLGDESIDELYDRPDRALPGGPTSGSEHLNDNMVEAMLRTQNEEDKLRRREDRRRQKMLQRSNMIREREVLRREDGPIADEVP